MALVKKHRAPIVEELPNFSTLDEAVDFFQTSEESDKVDYAVEEIVKFDGGGDFCSLI